jgi:aminoglycoside phosphotransferase (APT) family kinase protein
VKDAPMEIEQRLVDAVARVAAEAQGGVDPNGAEVLFVRGDVVVVRLGSVVAKVHAARQPRAALEARLALVRRPAIAPLFVELWGEAREVEGRIVTLWSAGRPLEPTEPDDVPWEAAARLLARLHRAPVGVDERLPKNGGPRRLAELVGRLDAMDTAAARDVRRAYAALPLSLREGVPATAAPVIVHGDFHLGQLVAIESLVDRWRLVDVDDMGIGDPAWDLARPAAWVAAGILDPVDFGRFVAAYAQAGGPGVDGADPWARLDLPARALTVQSAAVALAAAAREGRALTEIEDAFVGACPRIAALAP